MTAVDPGGFLQRSRYALEESLHHPDDKGEIEGQINDDKPGQSINQTQPAISEEEWDSEGDRRRHAGG